MLYLDANAFYWYYGRDRLPLSSSVSVLDVNKFQTFLEARTDKSLPTSVFMEMLVHFRDNPATIKKIVSFIEEKGMQIYNNFQGYCFTPNELTALRLTTEEDLLSRYSYNLLDKKIEVEAQYSHMFLQAVSLMYAIHYLKSCASLNEVARVNVLSYLGRDIFNELKDEYMTQLIDSLRAGYGDNNKSQQYLKQKYMELLTQNCVIYQMIVDTIVKYSENEQDLYAVMCKSASDARANGFTNDSIIAVIVDALAKDSVFIQEAKTEIPAIFVRKGYSKHQAEYMRVLLEAWLERGPSTGIFSCSASFMRRLFRLLLFLRQMP